jgi:oligoendopeptidase F
MTEPSLPDRQQLDPSFTWNDTSVFPDDDAWEQAVARLRAQLPELQSFRGSLGSSPDQLLAWLAFKEAMLQLAGKIEIYASLQHSVDTTSARGAALYDRARSLMAEVRGAAAFDEPELMGIGFDRLRAWMSDSPALASYEHVFDKLERRAAHLRSAEVETLLSQAADAFRSASAVHGTMTDADMTFEAARDQYGAEVPFAQGNYRFLVTSPDPDLRRTAWDHYDRAHLAVKNALSACLATGVKQHVFIARARGYGSCLEAALHPQAIPLEVFHNLGRHLPCQPRHLAPHLAHAAPGVGGRAFAVPGHAGTAC